jgi:hypothetical protein
MLLVKTKAGPSAIHGIGCMADQFIPKGTMIWRYVEGFDQKVPPAHVSRLSEVARETFFKYSYLSRKGDFYVLCFDDARFFNHSFSPNVIEVDGSDHDEAFDVAARDIHPGEELTCHYGSFEADFDPSIYK